MEIPTLLDRSPHKPTLDPSILINPLSVAARRPELASSVDESRSNQDLRGQTNHIEDRNKTSSQSHSGASLARVLNDPTSSSHSFQPASGRQTPQHAAFRVRSDEPGLASTPTSPDARRIEETHNALGSSGGDASLIQLPKPPQAPRKIAKRPRIPPLLQGLHQPPPLPPKSRLFPPITSDRSRLVTDVGDRFGLGNTYPNSSTEEQAKARVPFPKGYEANPKDNGRPSTVAHTQPEVNELDPATEPEKDRPPVVRPPSRANSQSKAPRKRNKWSQKETEDLLTGVSRFGIGRWKQILDCVDFHFQGRTAVDLKDRFRVCRPGEGLKARKTAAIEVPESSMPSEPAHVSDESGTIASRVRVSDDPISSIPETACEGQNARNSSDQTTTHKTEIHGPFLKSKRRARREFSETDDKNLLKGFERHGPVWHSMRDDSELEFGMRHPTDLRDRFRIRYPDLFAQAGYKLKPKDERVWKERENKDNSHEPQTSEQSSMTGDKPLNETTKTAAHADKNITSVTNDLLPAAVVKGSCMTSLATATAASQPSPLRPTFDLLTDLTFDDDDGDRSPIILNRNILQWADENSSSLPPTTTPAAILANNYASTDLLYNPFTTSDGLHINPLATLKLPSTTHWNYMNPSFIMAPPPSLPPPGPLMHALPVHTDHAGGMGGSRAPSTAATGTGLATPNSGAASRTMADMRTPNLPNIVFPYVPNASARNAVHNLPPPADILSSGQAGSDNYIWIG